MKLYFVNENARQGMAVYVGAVNGREALEYGKAYDVPADVAAKLLQNAGDWSKTAPEGINAESNS